MSGIQELDVRIDPDGSVHVEVHGVSGPGCEALTAELEAALGGQVIERRRKDSWFEQEQVAGHEQRLGQRG